MGEDGFKCDDCNKTVGYYLFGSKGDRDAVANNAHIGAMNLIEFNFFGIPDIVCFECMNKRPKNITY